MLISVIIPVYKVEKYIRECVDSFLRQDFQDYEMILVDDGSPDNSGAICDEYAAKFDFISVIHKANGGSADARNAGIQVARGDYILFVDSDDCIGNGSLKKVAECAIQTSQKADIVFLEAFKVFPDGSEVSLGDGYNADRINARTKKEVMEHLATLPKFPGSACTKLIKRSIILDNHLLFDKDVRSFEDIDMTIALLTYSETFAYCNAGYYYYRQSREGSVTNTIGLKNVKDMIYIIGKWASKDIGRPYQSEINAFMAYEYMITLYNYGAFKKEEKQEVKSQIKALSWVLKYGRSKKVKLVYICSKLIGLSFTSKILKTMHK